jgi:serine/threonine protein kinase
MLNGDPNVGPPCDFWALGVVLFQLLTKKRPFDDESEYLVYKRILHLQYKFPDNFPSDDARDLIRRLLVVKPEVCFLKLKYIYAKKRYMQCLGAIGLARTRWPKWN